MQREAISSLLQFTLTVSFSFNLLEKGTFQDPLGDAVLRVMKLPLGPTAIHSSEAAPWAGRKTNTPVKITECALRL